MGVLQGIVDAGNDSVLMLLGDHDVTKGLLTLRFAPSVHFDPMHLMQALMQVQKELMFVTAPSQALRYRIAGDPMDQIHGATKALEKLIAAMESVQKAAKE